MNRPLNIFSDQRNDFNSEQLKIRATTRVFPRRAMILSEGEINNFVYVILSGSVKVFIRGKSGNELIFGIHGVGDFLGELCLFDEAHTLTSSMALVKTKVLQISKDDIKAQSTKDPVFANHLLKRATIQIRALTERLGDIALTDVYDRVTKVLINSATPIDNHLVIDNPLSQQNMAGIVGASQAMVSKIFKELSVGGYIHIDTSTNKITINKRLPKSW